MSIIIKNTDAETLLNSLESESIDLIVTDPPYYKVKKDKWDNQWQSEDEFIDWCDRHYQVLSRP